jgi:transposase-like protein
LDLKRRGVEEVLLGIFDGLSGLSDVFRKVFPHADVHVVSFTRFATP